MLCNGYSAHLDCSRSGDGKSTRDTLGPIRHIVRAMHEHSVEEISQYNYGHKKDKILQFFFICNVDIK